VKTGKERSRAGPVETLVVIENANLQKPELHLSRFSQQEMTSIAGPGRKVKPERTGPGMLAKIGTQ
jgi:hypothetical protein